MWKPASRDRSLPLRSAWFVPAWRRWLGVGEDVLAGAVRAVAVVPEISRDELFRYFTLRRADAAFVDPGAGRGPGDRLGMAVQLATLPWLGFVPDDVASAPPAAGARLAERLGLDPRALRGDGGRAQTRSD